MIVDALHKNQGLDSAMAYTTSFANAFRLGSKIGRTFVFSLKTPTRVCEIINKYIN